MDDHPASLPDSLAALTAALATHSQNLPTVSLQTPTSVSAPVQYDESQLFH